MKRFLRWVGIIVAIPLVLFLIMFILLYIPPVQDYAVRKVTTYASEQTGMNIQVDRLRLSFLLDLDLQGLVVTDEQGDTLVAAQEAVVDLSLWHILGQRVQVEGIQLSDVHLDTKDLIATTVIKGQLQHFNLYDDIHLGEQHVSVKEVEASGLDIDIALVDTTVIDTTESQPIAWVIDIDKATIESSRVRFAMAGDSAMTAKADVELLSADSAHIDLGRQLYTVHQAQLQGPRAELWLQGDALKAEGAKPMALDSLNLTATAITFDGEAGNLSLPDVRLQLPGSNLTAAVDMDLAALEAGQGGGLDVSLSTQLSKAAILSAAGDMLPATFAKAYPDVPLYIKVSATGNMDKLSLRQAGASLPGSLYFDANGDLENLMDTTGILKGDIAYNLRTENINWVRGMAEGALDGIKLPPMRLGGTLSLNGTTYATKSKLIEGGSSLALLADVDLSSDLTYHVKLLTHQLQLNHFLPTLPTGPLTAQLTANGSGTDILSKATSLEAQAHVEQFSFDKAILDDTKLEARLRQGRGQARVNTNSPSLIAQIDVNALLVANKNISGKKLRNAYDLTFSLDLSRADLEALGIADHPLKTAMCLHMDGHTDLDRYHQLNGSINDIILMPRDTLFRPEDVIVDALLTPDTTYAYVSSGDLALRLRGHTGYDRLLDQLNHFMKELDKQIEKKQIDESALAHRLPQIDLRISSGQHNPAHDILASMGYEFDDARFGINLDPLIGINGGGHIYKLQTNGILLDTIRAHIYQDSTSIRMDARVRNEKYNPQIAFDSHLNLSLDNQGVAKANLTYLDDRGRKGIDVGLQGIVANDTLAIHLEPLNPIIAYRKFKLNPSNYLQLTKGNHVDADIDLLADDGTNFKFFSTPNADAQQDLSIFINRLNLGELSSVLPYLPRLGGLLYGDAHFIQKGEDISISADMNVDGMRYEDAPLGQIGLEAVYLPNADGSHFVDGNLLHTGLPVASFTGSYTPDEDDGLIDVAATLDRFPLQLGNGFIPDNMARLEGVAIGDIHVGGSTSKPQVNGDIASVGVKILSDPYSLNLRVNDDTLSIRNSVLNLDRVRILSTNGSPFTMDGIIDFSSLDRIKLDASMAAKNFELINAPKTPQAIAYGKVFVDFDSTIKGTLDNLRVLGRLNVLDNTNVTYVLTDSPLSVNDQLDGLVEFVDFGDSLRVEVEEVKEPQHINVTMAINIDEAAKVLCLLSPDGSSYVSLKGGGDLMMSYSPDKDLELNGRYTINSGTLKYTMMVIPLKEFTIKSGSYAEFHGPLMNPRLNISASEQMRTTVTENNQPRSVNFDVGLNITQTLENLGLEFTIDAPDDQGVQADLTTMSAEQRGRLAVTMLATGMYVNDAGANTSGGVTGQNALNALLQSQISNITSKALKSVDLSMGVEQGKTTAGTTTDYSFRLAKRFWNDRISIIVGGKVRTGQNAVNTGESIIDNVSIEYRLDKGASRYVNVFYDKNFETLLDGEVTEMGAGLVLRRKSNRLGELFIFKKKKEE